MILVTGGTGLVGAHLLHKLCLTNNSVYAIYRTENRKKITLEIFKFYGNTQLFNKIKWVKATLNDITTLEKAVKKSTHIYHCAAFVSFENNKSSELTKINTEGTANLVNLALTHQVKKLCYISSIATLNKKPGQDLIDENCDWNPEEQNSDYSISKYGAEMEVWRAAQEGLAVNIVNPGLIFGFGNWTANTGQLFNKINKGLPFFTKGTTGVVDVEDVVNASVQLMESNIKGERFILVGKNISYKSLFTTIAKHLKVKAPSIKASKLITEISWRIGAFINFISFNTISPSINKYSAKASHNTTLYDGSKIEKFINFNYTSFDDTIKKICKYFLL